MNADHEDTVVYDGQFIQTIRRSFIRHGQTLTWEMVRRKVFGHVVAVAAVTPKLEIILIKIWRVPLLDYVFELPAGLMDKPNESEGDCARRELLEETGYETDPLCEIIRGPFNAGLTSDEVVHFCGLNARPAQDPCHEKEEEIEVIKMPLQDMESFLYSGRHRVDVKIACVLPYFRTKGLLR